MRHGLSLTAGALLAVAGCTPDAAQLVVVIGTDLRAPEELARYEIRVRDERGRERFYGVREATGPSTLPASFGVAPVGRDPGRTVEVEVGAIGGSIEPFATRARTRFSSGQRMRLDLFLARGCERIECDAELTCRRGTCEDPWVDPNTLPPWDDGEPLASDAGASDAGTHDAALDGPADAGDDARVDGAPGAYCGPTAPCDADLFCQTYDLGDEGMCNGSCATAADCGLPESRCESTYFGGVCTLPCDPMRPDESCEGALVCLARFIGDLDTDGISTVASCFVPGTGQLGEACGAPGACAPGLACGRVSDGALVCLEVCATDDDCDAGGACLPFEPPLEVAGISFGACE